MFTRLQAATLPISEATQANQILADEAAARFPSFSANDAVTLGLSIRKRFRASSRHAKGKGLVISVQSIAGHTLFACTVGDLGHHSGFGDVSLDSWTCIEQMVGIVKRTGHASYYVEKGMSALNMTPKQMGLQGDVRVQGGAYPIWLENALICPIGVVACYSGSSQDDHQLVATTVKDYLTKMRRESNRTDTPPPVAPLSQPATMPTMPVPSVPILVPPRESTVRIQEWLQEPLNQTYPETSTPMNNNTNEYDTYDNQEP